MDLQTSFVKTEISEEFQKQSAYISNLILIKNYLDTKLNSTISLTPEDRKIIPQLTSKIDALIVKQCRVMFTV